jgi:hypothetical protein
MFADAGGALETAAETWHNKFHYIVCSEATRQFMNQRGTVLLLN